VRGVLRPRPQPLRPRLPPPRQAPADAPTSSFQLPRRYVTPPQLAGARLDQGLAELAKIARRHARRLIDAGQLRLDAKPTRNLSRRLATGSVLDVLPPHDGIAPPASLPPVELVFEDRWLVALVKPAGMTAAAPRRRGAGELTAGEALAMVLSHRAGRRVDVILVHRLDRPTSGLMLFALHPRAAQGLGRAFQRGAVTKRYLAVVTGDPGPAEVVLDQPVGRDPLTPGRFAVARDGRPARTLVRSLWRQEPYSLVEARPLTGRSHQIRVHLASAGWPIVGDTLYGGASAPRLMLHAWRLALPHPVTGAVLSLRAPAPQDWTAHLGRCGLQLPADG